MLQADRGATAFMDIVDTFNHLIPSDQLDDSMVIGQNLECEASNEFGSGLDHLEDSLMNMLSDKDPMFGSASSQFNLLDNEDTHFQIPASTGMYQLIQRLCPKTILIRLNSVLCL